MRVLLALALVGLVSPAAAAFANVPDPLYREADQSITQQGDVSEVPQALREQTPLTQRGDVTVYPTYPVLTEELKLLAAEHKDIVRLHSAGVTDRGLHMWLLEIADFENPDRVPLEDREVVFIDGGVHANEPTGVMFVMEVLRFLTYEYGENETATWIVENRHTYIMPLANPEGSMHPMGRLNYDLVNINRNFPVGWGDVEEAPVVNNPGPYPASEPETRTLIDWWLKVNPDYYASVHCCGNLWLYPYGMDGRDPHPDDYPVLERICDEAYYDVREDCGPIWSTIYPASGSTVDTAYEYTGAVSFGFEMSTRQPSVHVSQGDIRDLQLESWRGVMHAFMNVHLYGAYPEAAVTRVAADALTLTVTNRGFGNLSAATVEVVDASGAVVTAAVPRLGPEESAEVHLEGAFAAGAYPVTVTYQKRPFDPGVGVRDLALTVTGAGDALAASLTDAVGGAVVEDLPLRAAGGVKEAPVPWLAAVAGFAVAVGLRRRVG